MGYATDVGAAGRDAAHAEEASRVLAKVARFGERAVAELPAHRALVRRMRE